MIRTRREEGLLQITLDRPERANALTAEMLAAMVDALSGPAPAAFVLSGAGSVFSAGADLGEARRGLAVSALWAEVSDAISALPCPSVAALNGTCAGGAVGLILACDMRVAVPTAELFYPVIRLGFRPQPPDPARLKALVGPARASLILLGGARLTAAEAQAIGLVDRLAEDAEAHARELLAPACAADPELSRAIKAMIAAG